MMKTALLFCQRQNNYSFFIVATGAKKSGGLPGEKLISEFLSNLYCVHFLLG